MKIRFPFPVLLLTACMTNPFVRDTPPVLADPALHSGEAAQTEAAAEQSVTEQPAEEQTETATKDAEEKTASAEETDEAAEPEEQPAEEPTETAAEDAEEKTAPVEETDEAVEPEEQPAEGQAETVTETAGETTVSAEGTNEAVEPEEQPVEGQTEAMTEPAAEPAAPAEEETDKPAEPDGEQPAEGQSEAVTETAAESPAPAEEETDKPAEPVRKPVVAEENPLPVINAPAVENKKSLIGTEENKPLTLADRLQAVVADEQAKAVAALPSEIEGFAASGSVADRESNQKGAGFTRVYADKDVVVTVFVYNNQEFGFSDEITPAVEALLDRHLQEIKSMEASGLYSAVRIGDKHSLRDLRWRREKFRVVEGEAQFVQNEEKKKTVIMLTSDKKLMSYVRVRFTYPRDQRWKVEEKKGRFTATVLYALREFSKGKQ